MFLLSYSAIYLDIGNKLIEIIFCKDAAKKAALIEERRQPTKDAFGRLGNLVKVGFWSRKVFGQGKCVGKGKFLHLVKVGFWSRKMISCLKM